MVFAGPVHKKERLRMTSSLHATMVEISLDQCFEVEMALKDYLRTLGISLKSSWITEHEKEFCEVGCECMKSVWASVAVAQITDNDKLSVEVLDDDLFHLVSALECHVESIQEFIKESGSSSKDVGGRLVDAEHALKKFSVISACRSSLLQARESLEQLKSEAVAAKML